MDIRDPKTLVDYAKSLDCIHCGLCLTTCPTYRITGAESSSPRGRIHLMRAVAEERLEPDADFADEMSFCLLCRHCESVCPAGVRFGAMMEYTRAGLAKRAPGSLRARLLRWLGFRVLLPHRAALGAFAALARCARRTGLEWLGAPLLRRLGVDPASAPDVPPARERRRLPEHVPAHARWRGAERARVALLEGCVMPVLFGRVNRATVDSLAALGVACDVPHGQTCCGSLHAHNGDLDGARTLARRTIEAFEPGAPQPIVVNSAGCGSHLRELHHLFGESDPWRARAEAVAQRVVDYTRFVAPLLAAADVAPQLDAGAVAQPVAWDDPCHLCHGQGVRAEPRAALDAIGGLERVELEDSEDCCGSAGIYSILRPADSAAVLEPKLDALERSGARTLVTANPGCQMQWESGLRRRGSSIAVVHLAELVARAMRSAGA